MKAIITRSYYGKREVITLLGSGIDEENARIEASHRLNHGYDEDEGQYMGGEMVDVSKKLESLFHGAGFDQTETDSGGVMVSANSYHGKLISALAQLKIDESGDLSY